MTHWELCHREKSSGLRARKPERRPRSAPEPLSHVGGRLSSPPRTWHPLASQECHRPRWPQTGHAGPESRWPSCAWRREPRRAGSRVFPGSLSLARRSPNLRAHPWVSPLSPPISKEPEVASRPRPGSRCPPPIAPPRPAHGCHGADLSNASPGPRPFASRSGLCFAFSAASLSFPSSSWLGVPLALPSSSPRSFLRVRSQVRTGDHAEPRPRPVPAARGPRPVPTRDVGASSVVVLQRFLLSPGTRHF